jgi:hypothetical protein
MFLTIYTAILLLAGAVGYSVKRDIRIVLLIQFIVSFMMVLFAEMILQFSLGMAS